MNAKLFVLFAAAWLSACPVRARGARLPAGGRNLLVVYAADGPDRDGSGTADSKEAAEYYARRRGVPAENLLGLKAQRDPARKGRWTYPEVFGQLLTPVAEKLAAKAGDGKPLSRHVCYILLCPDIPVSMVTHPAAPKEQKSWFRKSRNRSVDGYLISLDRNIQAGVDEETAAPGGGTSGPVGSVPAEIVLPIFSAFHPGPGRKSFRQLRTEYPDRINFYLVSRLGLDLGSARNMLDGAIYAERYLRLPGSDEKAAFRPAIWLDQKYRFASDHVTAMSRAVPMVQGMTASPFAAGKGLLQVWPLVIDNQLAEIGSGKSAGHKPTVTATITRDGVDEKGVTLASPRKLGRRSVDAPAVLYFPPGCTVTCVKPEPRRPKTRPAPTEPAATGPASAPAATAPSTAPTEPSRPPPTAKVVGIDVAGNRLLLDSTEGFRGGYVVQYVWPGEFPIQDCFIFYGFYGLGAYEDVFQFPPGALGVHVDSGCMRWARAAIHRGIAATFGVTAEPLSAGIPYGNNMLLALAGGYDWAESVYGALRLAQRWMGVVFGDPLYAPFRSKQLIDKTPPVIGPVTVKPAGRGAVVIAAALAGKTPDELADVALFKLEYGPTTRYGKTVDFYDWPEPQKPCGVKGRRFGYSRHFRWKLKELAPGRTYHFRLTARDPAGLETQTPDATFRP